MIYFPRYIIPLNDYIHDLPLLNSSHIYWRMFMIKNWSGKRKIIKQVLLLNLTPAIDHNHDNRTSEWITFPLGSIWLSLDPSNLVTIAWYLNAPIMIMFSLNEAISEEIIDIFNYDTHTLISNNVFNFIVSWICPLWSHVGCVRVTLYHIGCRPALASPAPPITFVGAPGAHTSSPGDQAMDAASGTRNPWSLIHI